MRQLPQSFLLRLWRERSEAPWRVTLIAVAQPAAPPRHFASLAALYAFLGDLAGETSGTTDDLNDTDCTSPETG